MSKTSNFILDTLRNPTDNCVEWPFAIDGGGYPHIRRGSKNPRVHRFMCEIVHGPCPPEMRDAAHNCGNRKCINPKHLRWATRSDNCMDKVAHGTTNRGEKHGKVKLTEQQVRQLRAAYRADENISALAREWGIKVHTAIQAARGRTWKWLRED